MLNEKEIERFELIEMELRKLRSEVKVQHLVISGLLNSFFTEDNNDHSHFYSAIREKLNGLPPGSDIQHILMTAVEKWANTYKS
ncbi:MULTISPECIES: hypothetical protein [unclassified Pantoea]|uniref:hypothetical protein n=1 Tax=unclassified Pantoea TaxID=2630326 RepID=UPI00301CAA1B|nr:hypothetical protein [Erwiniaceae bacterium L1_55_4]